MDTALLAQNKPTRPEQDGRRTTPPAGRCSQSADYSAGADGCVGAGVACGAGSVVVAGGLAGCSAGGVVLCVVVLSVPLSLQAAMLSSARAENEARTIFFMIFLSFTIDTRGRGSQLMNAVARERLRHLR